MIRNFLFFIFCIIFFFNQINATKLSQFTDVNKPHMFAVDNKKLYISDQCSVKVFSLDSFKLIKKIGERGEGPGEFKMDPDIQIMPDLNEIILHTRFKLIIYNKSGKILKEKRFDNFIQKLLKISNNYIISDWNFLSNSHKFEIKVLNKDFDKIRSISLKKIAKKRRKEIGKLNITLISPKLLIRCSSDRIFISNEREDFYIKKACS